MVMKKFSLLIAMAALVACQTTKYEPGIETARDKDARMEWWRDARFGMFIHWGLYSVPAGQWNGGTNHAEWIRTTAQIPLETYEKFLDDFNPVKFDAVEWVKMAKSAGMKYITITSKHHDGFCLFDSKQTDFDVMSTPFKRDIMKELADACHDAGIKICWYHSIMDWHHPDYLPRRNWEKDRTVEGADFDRYVEYMKKELKELLTRYGPIGVLWFDGEWENTWNNVYGEEIYNYVRSLQPDIIINNRVGASRAGMEGLTQEGGFGGDFGTPEQTIPATGLPGVDWESCMTMNDHWGYNLLDKNFKTSKDLLQKLADIASKGGNFLLNVGPTAEGTFPQESIDRLADIGRWMDINGEAIYETQGSPFKNLEWGRCTQKSLEGGTRLYLHVFDWPEDGKLLVPGLGSQPIRSFILADPNQEELTITRKRDAVEIALPGKAPDLVNSIVILDIVGDAVVYEAPKIEAGKSNFVQDLEIQIIKDEDKSQIRYTMDGSEPNENSPVYSGPIILTETTTIAACCFVAEKPISNTVYRTFSKVIPISGNSLPGLKTGLKYNYYEGEWDKIPSFSGMSPKKQGVVENFDLAAKEIEENFSIDYQGFIEIPQDGVYTFYLTSDDGSKMYLGDEVLIDNDGLHSAKELSGEIPLGKGIHAIRISFFENTGGNLLNLSWDGPGIEKQTVPSIRLFHIN